MKNDRTEQSMNNSISIQASSIHLTDNQDFVCIVNDYDRYNHMLELETVLNIMENLLLINDYNLEEEQVAVDRYYSDMNSFRHEEVEKTEWFDMYDFINDLTLDQASQILTSFLISKKIDMKKINPVIDKLKEQGAIRAILARFTEYPDVKVYIFTLNGENVIVVDNEFGTEIYEKQKEDKN